MNIVGFLPDCGAAERIDRWSMAPSEVEPKFANSADGPQAGAPSPLQKLNKNRGFRDTPAPGRNRSDKVKWIFGTASRPAEQHSHRNSFYTHGLSTWRFGKPGRYRDLEEDNILAEWMGTMCHSCGSSSPAALCLLRCSCWVRGNSGFPLSLERHPGFRLPGERQVASFGVTI